MGLFRPLEQNDFEIEPQSPEKEKIVEKETKEVWNDEYDIDLSDDLDDVDIQEEPVHSQTHPNTALTHSSFAGHQALLGSYEKVLDLLKK
jgi:hypothetical protein